jgi:hypothetical protein
VDGEECTYTTVNMFDEKGELLPNTYTMAELGLPEDLFLRLFEVYRVLMRGNKDLSFPALREELEEIKGKIVEAAVALEEHRKAVRKLLEDEDYDGEEEAAYEGEGEGEEKWKPQQGDVEWEEETKAKLAALNGWKSKEEEDEGEEDEEVFWKLNLMEEELEGLEGEELEAAERTLEEALDKAIAQAKAKKMAAQ